MITLKTLKDSTAQEVFDQVAHHLLTQNKKSLSDRDDSINRPCQYRTDNGLKCAAGCLIGDDEYNEKFENLDWKGMVARRYANPKHVQLILALQMIHDKVAVEYWKEELNNVAEIFNLKGID